MDDLKHKQMEQDEIWREKVRKHEEEDKKWEEEKRNRRDELYNRLPWNVDSTIESKLQDEDKCIGYNKRLSKDDMVNEMMNETQLGVSATSFSLGLLTSLGKAGIGVTTNDKIELEDKNLISHNYFRHIKHVTNALVEDSISDKNSTDIKTEVAAAAEISWNGYIDKSFMEGCIEGKYVAPKEYNLTEGDLTMIATELKKALGDKSNRKICVNIRFDDGQCHAIGYCPHCDQDVICKNKIDKEQSTIVCHDHLQIRTKEDFVEIKRIENFSKAEEKPGICIAHKTKNSDELCGKTVLEGELFCEKHHGKYTQQYLLPDDKKCTRLIAKGNKKGGICGNLIYAHGFCFDHQEKKIVIKCEYKWAHPSQYVGQTCGRQTKNGNKFCGIHRNGQPILKVSQNVCQGKKIDGSNCTFNAKMGNFCGHHKKQIPPKKRAAPEHPIELTEEEKIEIEKRQKKQGKQKNQAEIPQDGFCSVTCKNGSRCQNKVNIGNICGRHMNTKMVIKSPCLAFTAKGDPCTCQAQEESQFCGKHKNYQGKINRNAGFPSKSNKVDKKESKVVTEEVNTTDSSSTTETVRKIVTAPRKLKKVITIEEKVEEVPEEELLDEKQPTIRIVKVEKVELVEDSDEEMEECEIEEEVIYLPKKTPKAINPNDIQALGMLTGWTEQQIARMKNLHIYTRVCNPDKTLNVEKTIEETRTKLLHHFNDIDKKCRGVLNGVDTIFKEFAAQKAKDIEKSFSNLFGLKGPLYFDGRKKVAEECSKKVKDLKEISRRRTRLLRDLPPYEGNYALPDVDTMVAKLREGACVKSKIRDHFSKWEKIYEHLNLERVYWVDPDVKADYYNPRFSVERLLVEEKKKRDNEKHEWILTSFIHTILEYRQALLDNKTIGRIENFKDNLLGSIELAQRSEMELIERMKRTEQMNQIEIMERIKQMEQMGQIERVDYSTLEFMSGMKIEDLIDHITINYRYDTLKDIVSAIETGDENTDSMNISPKVASENQPEIKQKTFLKFQLPEGKLKSFQGFNISI
jgi:hypothetical protein